MTPSHASTNIALQIGVIILTLITAFVHLSLNFPDPVFILNGLGYLTLLATLYLPISQLVPYRRLVRWLLIGYAGLTVILWLAIGLRTSIGYTTTADKVLLILLLLLETRRSRSS